MTLDVDTMIVQLQAKADLLEQEQERLLRRMIDTRKKIAALHECQFWNRCRADDLREARQYLGPRVTIIEEEIACPGM